MAQAHLQIINGIVSPINQKMFTAKYWTSILNLLAFKLRILRASFRTLGGGGSRFRGDFGEKKKNEKSNGKEKKTGKNMSGQVNLTPANARRGEPSVSRSRPRLTERAHTDTVAVATPS